MGGLRLLSTLGRVSLGEKPALVFPLVLRRGHRLGEKANLKSEGVIHLGNVSSAPLKGRVKSRHTAGTKECVVPSIVEQPMRSQ